MARVLEQEVNLSRRACRNAYIGLDSNNSNSKQRHKFNRHFNSIDECYVCLLYPKKRTPTIANSRQTHQSNNHSLSNLISSTTELP